MDDCSIDNQGRRTYSGKVNITEDGKECQPWEESPIKLPSENLNYCRNPDMDPIGPWCFPKGHSISSQGTDESEPPYCKAPTCSKYGKDSSLVK